MKKVNMTLSRLALLAVFGIVSTGCGGEEISKEQLATLKALTDAKVDAAKLKAAEKLTQGIDDTTANTKITEATKDFVKKSDLVDIGLAKEVDNNGKKTHVLSDKVKEATELDALLGGVKAKLDKSSGAKLKAGTFKANAEGDKFDLTLS